MNLKCQAKKVLCNIYLGLLLEYLVRTEATLELLLSVATLLRLDHDELWLGAVLYLPDPSPRHWARDTRAGVFSILGLRRRKSFIHVRYITRVANLTQLSTCIRK